MDEINNKGIFFNAIPHLIRDAFRKGLISPPEMNLLVRLRTDADFLGQVYTSADILRKDIFSNQILRGTVNDHLLSLRTLGCLTYPDRKGNGGAFQLLLNHWLTKDGVWLRMVPIGVTPENGSEVLSAPLTRPEVSTKVDIQKRRFDGLKRVGFEGRMDEMVKAENGGNYNDIEKQKDINYVRSSIKEVGVQEFVPKSDVDDKLKRIAESVNEEYMGFVFWVYGERKDAGIWTMEKVASDLVDKPGVLDKRKYFNSEVRRQLGL